MSDTQPLAYAYFTSHRAKKRDRRSSTGPFLGWTPPGGAGVPFVLFREPDGILMVSPDLLPPDTLAALPSAPAWNEGVAEIIGRITVTEKE